MREERAITEDAEEHCLELLMALIAAARNGDKAMYTRTRKIIRGLVLEDPQCRFFFEHANLAGGLK